jgi:hypothetical protein
LEVASKIFFFIKTGGQKSAKPPVEGGGGFDSDFLKNPTISISFVEGLY